MCVGFCVFFLPVHDHLCVDAFVKYCPYFPILIFLSSQCVQNGKTVYPTIRALIESEGSVRRLTIKEAKVEDEGRYSVETNADSSSARLTLRGKDMCDETHFENKATPFVGPSRPKKYSNGPKTIFYSS